MKIRQFGEIALPKFGAVYGIIIFILYFSVVTDNYLSVSNLSNILRQSVVLCIIALCAFLAMLTHQVDLSVGGAVGLTGMVVALMMEKGAAIEAACLCGILAAVLYESINAVLAALTTIPTFIITLATMGMAESLGMVIRTGTIQITNESFKWFSGGHVGYIPFPAILVAVLYAIFWYILRHRRYGTYLYAVGGKEEAALTAGINVKLIKGSVYLINGLLVGIAGIMLASRLSSANPSSGMGLELDGICSVVLGGTALNGGRGSIFGALLGAIAIALLRNGMNMMALRLVTQKLVIGVVLLIILILDVLRKEEKGTK